MDYSILYKKKFDYKKIIKIVPKSKRKMEYYFKKKEELEEIENNSEIDIIYGDESHFKRTTNLPYQWMEKGTRNYVEGFNDKSFTIMGFYNKVKNKLHYFLNEYKNKSINFIENVENIINKIDKNFKKTVLVLDNCSIHKSKLVKAKLDEWKEKGLELFYLPPYSPELNPIELFWEHCKNKIKVLDRKDYKTFKISAIKYLNVYSY